MTQQDVLLIHGTWGHGKEWDEFGAQLTARGYRVHAPSWPGHGHPKEIDVWGMAEEVTQLGILDYVDALADVARSLETPPIIFGHSVGGLLAQLVAARVPHRGIVLLGPAPAAGVWALYPSQIALWGGFTPRWIMGRPMFPVKKKTWDKYICNAVDQSFSDEFYSNLCAESGRAYREMVFWFLDPKRSTRVNFEAITGDVLVIAGSEDKCCVPSMCKATAKRYRGRADYVELDGSDHMMIGGPYMDATLQAFDTWAAAKGITATTS
ncbi:alpha/beta hydrolase [Nocardioides marinus]|uniref:Pimeloyl-ACP methyl ester carboxylesterase n=1 Tax=Nocardioides marinus TaxID=374514 RepID=A0A7Z0C5Y6_9ACTN|nr:alpha/beta hydrolase [Nocardioides marinus]NYI11591.1 pimeloyl-ACP methyl ester carboxylesterase [Nocardioides marinus]